MCDGDSEYCKADLKGTSCGGRVISWYRPGFPRIVYQMRETLGRIKIGVQVNDWVSVLADFDALIQQVEILHTTHPNPLDPARPSQILMETLVLLGNNLSRNKKRKMSPESAQAFCSIKQELNKYTKLCKHYIIEYRYYKSKKEPEPEPEPEEGEDYYSDNDDYVEPCVKDETETAWESVQQKLVAPSSSSLDPDDHLEKSKQLTVLTKHAVTPAQNLTILFTAIKAKFNTTSHSLSKHVPIPLHVWKECVQNMLTALDILTQYPNIVTVSSSTCASVPTTHETKKTSSCKGEIQVEGNLVEFLLRIYFEFDMGLKFIYPDTECYVERLNDEAMLFLLAQNVLAYLRKVRDFTQAVTVAMLLVELVYHKSQGDYDRLRKLVEEFSSSSPPIITTSNLDPQQSSLPRTCRVLMDRLVSFIYNYGYSDFQTMAMVYDVYNYAIIDNFSHAEDFLLTNCVSEKIQCMGNDSIKLHFNRAKAQLGLCAFRLGRIQQAHSLLSQLHEGGRIEDQLAQGVSHILGYNSDLALKGKRGQVPLFMHINLELLEAVHLICSMLIEEPKSERLFFTSHSSTREHVIAASWALRDGNFKKSVDIIKSMKLWNLLQNRGTVLWMLKTKIKEKAMLSYLFAYSSYAPVSVDKLTRMFELSEARVMSIVGYIMKELHASWDQHDRCIVFHDVNVKRRRLMEPAESRHAVSFPTIKNRLAIHLEMDSPVSA